MTAIETLASFIAEGMRGRVPAATRDLAKLHLTDVVGAWIGGAQTAEGRALARAAPTGGDLGRDVGLHCALARLSETDNIHLASTTTPGGIVIPAALTIAAARPATSADALLEAIVAGTEAMVRLGFVIGGPTVLYRGIWPTYFAAPFGVAAVAARLDNLDALQTAHALALALTFASPGVGHHNAATTSRWFAIGYAARNGFAAAHAARDGFTSDLSLLDGGFLQGIYGITPDVAAFTQNLGGRLALDDTSIKPWCAARQTIAATQAVLEIIEGGVPPETITSVEVHVPPTYLKMIDHGVKPDDRASHLTSVQYNVALAACDVAGLYDIAHSPQTMPGAVEAFVRKVTVSADEALLAHYPKAWPARVVVHTASGKHEQAVIQGWGDPQRPFGEWRVADKFRRVVAPVAAAAADTLIARCRSALDTDRSAAGLVQAIAEASRA